MKKLIFIDRCASKEQLREAIIICNTVNARKGIQNEKDALSTAERTFTRVFNLAGFGRFAIKEDDEPLYTVEEVTRMFDALAKRGCFSRSAKHFKTAKKILRERLFIDYDKEVVNC